MPTWCVLFLSCWIALVGRSRCFCAELVRCYTLLLKECRRGAANRERVLVDARGREKKLPLVHCTVHRWGLASLVRLWESLTFLSGNCQNARWEMLPRQNGAWSICGWQDLKWIPSVQSSLLYLVKIWSGRLTVCGKRLNTRSSCKFGLQFGRILSVEVNKCIIPVISQIGYKNARADEKGHEISMKKLKSGQAIRYQTVSNEEKSERVSIETDPLIQQLLCGIKAKLTVICAHCGAETINSGGFSSNFYYLLVDKFQITCRGRPAVLVHEAVKLRQICKEWPLIIC